LRHFALSLLALAAGATALAQPTENDVKAAFLPRFARYVSWPAAAAPSGSNPFVLCVIGDDRFGDQLSSAAATQTVDGRRIVVRHLDSAAGADQCQIAYVAGSRAESTAHLLSNLNRKPILTVTDSRNGAARGDIHFTVSDGRVRFYIDEADASSRGLTISSRLLALAIGVKQR
jgi:hypothetical protein